MSTNQYFGAGTLVQFGGTAASAGAYVTLGGIKGDIKGTSTTVVVDTTSHDTCAADIVAGHPPSKRKAGAIVDEGSYSFEMFSDLGDSTGQLALFNSRGKTGFFKLVPAAYTSPGHSVTFSAVIGATSATPTRWKTCRCGVSS